MGTRYQLRWTTILVAIALAPGGCLQDRLHRPEAGPLHIPWTRNYFTELPDAVAPRPGHDGEISLVTSFRPHRLADADLQSGAWLSGFEDLTVSADGEWFALRGGPPRSAVSLIDPLERDDDAGFWVLRMDGSDARLVGPWRSVLDLAVGGPDDVRLLVGSPDGLEVWMDAEGVERIPIPADQVLDAYLCPSGDRVILTEVGFPETARMVDLENGESFLDLSDWTAFRIEEFVTARHCVLVRGEDGAILDVETGTVRPFPLPFEFEREVARHPDGHLIGLADGVVHEYSFDVGEWIPAHEASSGSGERVVRLLYSDAGAHFVTRRDVTLVTRGATDEYGRLHLLDELELPRYRSSASLGWDPAGDRLLVAGGHTDSLIILDVDRHHAEIVPGLGSAHAFWYGGDHLGALVPGDEVATVLRRPVSGGVPVEVAGVPVGGELGWVSFSPSSGEVLFVENGQGFLVHAVGMDGTVRTHGPIERIPMSLLSGDHPVLDGLGPMVASYAWDGSIRLHTVEDPPITVPIVITNLYSVPRAALVPGRAQLAVFALWDGHGPRLLVYDVGVRVR